jgi:flavorubredoxin
MHSIDDLPIRFLDNEKVAPDTYVIRQLYGEGVNPVAMHVNSMVITGAEPVIVDTGPALTRAGWLEHAFELVDPSDVKWIYLSHDDVDHTGNLTTVLEMCQNATLVTNWFSVERMAADTILPLERMRWVNDGESFSVGDRELVAVLPPVFDSPTTRGLFDPKTGVYWAADAFACPVTHQVDSISQLDPGFWREAFSATQRVLSPWHQWLDPGRFQQHLDRVHSLGASVVTSGHSVALRGGQIDSAFELLKEIPYLPAAPLPGQLELEAILAGMMSTAAVQAA